MYIFMSVYVYTVCMYVARRERRTTVPACPGSIETFNPHLFSHDGFVKAAQSAGFLPPHTRTRTRAREAALCLPVCLSDCLYIYSWYLHIHRNRVRGGGQGRTYMRRSVQRSLDFTE